MNALSRRLERVLPEDVVKQAKDILKKERITFSRYLETTPDGLPPIYASAFTEFIDSAPSFKITSPRNPPTKDGMMEAFQQLNELICSTTSSGSFAMLRRVPILLSKLWELLNMYYVFQLFRETPPLSERAFCDAMEHPAEVSRYFFVLGEYLKAHPTILNHLLDRIHEFSDFIFRDFTPHETCSEWLTTLRYFRHNRPTLDQRCRFLACLRYWFLRTFGVVYSGFLSLRLGVRRRYFASLFDTNIYKLEDISVIGCIYGSCPLKKRLLMLAVRHKEGNLKWDDLSEEEKTLIARWGQDVKFCARCRLATYCSEECQKEDWGDIHRSECRGPDTLKAIQHRLASASEKDAAYYSGVGKKLATARNDDAF